MNGTRTFYLLYESYADFELVFAVNDHMGFKTATVGSGRTPCRSL